MCFKIKSISFFQSNANTSTSVLSRDQKAFVRKLVIKPKPPSQHGNSSALCWKFFGQLSESGKVVDESRVYCSLCLDVEQKLGDKGHISQVSNFASSTSTGNLNLHLSSKHDVVTNSDEKSKKILNYFKNKASLEEQFPAMSNHELNRDIAMWFCRDLLPFEAVSMDGFSAFFAKNMPHIGLPTSRTLGNTALNDIYQALRSQVKDKLSKVNSICLMFDGWTDRYRAWPYLGVRVSFLQDWKYSVATLGCHILPTHTAKAVADHVNDLLTQFFDDTKKLYITSCHDGASNMVKSSKLLKVDTYQHCAAHCLHLLLTTDSINKFDEVVELLQRCRDIVSKLHFKTLLIEDEIAATNDKVIIEKMQLYQQQMSEVNEILDIDDQYLSEIRLHESNETDQPLTQLSKHSHQSLKAACPTRWNSTLRMIESLVELKREVNNALKRSGNVDMCLVKDEYDFLEQLVEFLRPFKDFTDLFSCSMPNLSVIPIMKMRIKKSCRANHGDDPKMSLIKEAVLTNLENSFPDTNRTKLHQLLDPETKAVIPRAEAQHLIEEAMEDAKRRGFIKV